MPRKEKEIRLPKEQKVNRSQHIRRGNDNIGDIGISLYDIDETIKYYFDNVIMPQVPDSQGNLIQVPTIYGSPQRWKSAQASGFMRDKNGRIQIPLIMYKRGSITKNRTLARHFDSNDNNLYYTFENHRTQVNKYDQFSILTGSKPMKEFHKIVVPDYLDITYQCVIWCEYIEQLNKIIESVQYAEGSYWGNPERFKFMARIDSFDGITELSQGEDRTVRSSFSIDMSGHIIPDVLQKKLKTTSQKVFTYSKVIFIGEGASEMMVEKEVRKPINENEISPSEKLRGLGASETANKEFGPRLDGGGGTEVEPC